MSKRPTNLPAPVAEALEESTDVGSSGSEGGMDDPDDGRRKKGRRLKKRKKRTRMKRRENPRRQLLNACFLDRNATTPEKTFLSETKMILEPKHR